MGEFLALGLLLEQLLAKYSLPLNSLRFPGPIFQQPRQLPAHFGSLVTLGSLLISAAAAIVVAVASLKASAVVAFVVGLFQAAE
jgi:hypothetical protein